MVAARSLSMQQCLNFFPLPQGQGSFLPIFIGMDESPLALGPRVGRRNRERRRMQLIGRHWVMAADVALGLRFATPESESCHVQTRAWTWRYGRPMPMYWIGVIVAVSG